MTNKFVFFSHVVFLYIVVSQPAASSPTPVASSSSEEGKGDTPKPKKNRCFMCRKRVGLTGEQGGDEGASDATHTIPVSDTCFTGHRWKEFFLTTSLV